MNKSVAYIGGLLVSGLVAYLLWQNHEQKQLLSQIISQPVAENAEKQQGPVPTVDSSNQDQRLDKIELTLIKTIDKLSELSESQKAIMSELESRQNDNVRTETITIKAPVKENRPTPQERQAKINDLVNRFESNLNDTSNLDEAWTSSTVAMIDDKFSSIDNLKIAESKNVTCGSSVCKVESVVPADASADEKQNFEFQMLLTFNSELPRATTMQEKLPDGSVKYVHYYTRRGHSVK